MANTFNAHMSDEALQKVFHDGITAKFKADLRAHLLTEAKIVIEQIVEDSAKHLIRQIQQYHNLAQGEVQYLIKIDGVEKAKGQM
jgi:hypothetical protein